MQSSEKASVKLMVVIEFFSRETSEDGSRYSRSHLRGYAGEATLSLPLRRPSVKLMEVIGSFSQDTSEEGSRYSGNHLQR
jgi:hypothetical protein